MHYVVIRSGMTGPTPSNPHRLPRTICVSVHGYCAVSADLLQGYGTREWFNAVHRSLMVTRQEREIRYRDRDGCRAFARVCSESATLCCC